jgi:hypothetical protein
VIQAIDEQETDTAEDGLDAPQAPGKEEQKHRFVLLRAKGYSYARIAKELGVSKGTLTAWNLELEAVIARTRAVELEALQEEFFLLKEGRIRLIGEQLKAIQTERKRGQAFDLGVPSARHVLLRPFLLKSAATALLIP